MDKRTYHHGALRDAILDAAIEIVREDGITGFTLAKAARRTGVSTGAPYQHFGGARQVLVAAAARGYQELAARFGSLATEQRPPAARIEDMAMTYITYALEDPARFRVMAAFGDAVMADPHQRVGTEESDRHWRQVCTELTGAERADDLTLAMLSVAHGAAQLATNRFYSQSHGLDTEQVLSASRRSIRAVIEERAPATPGPDN